MKDKKECPCYVCIVASMCIGKEPTPEEWDEISRQVDEHDKKMYNDIEVAEDLEANGFRHFPIDFDPYEPQKIPEIEAQLACPFYQEWSDFRDVDLSVFDDYLGEEMF